MSDLPRKKLKNAKPRELSAFDYLELKEYDQNELLDLFNSAIYDMAKKGILNPVQTKEYISNIQKWLIEELET